MKLNPNLLFSDDINWSSRLNGTNAKGMYSTMQFVLRLRDDVRTALDQNEITPERIQAFSTLLHENIHWWQHAGSNFGFLFNLSYPAFTSLCIDDLKTLVKKKILFKSILKFDTEYYNKNHKTDIAEVNRILNTYYDLEYAKRFAMDNKSINETANDNRFFLHMGHCYFMFWFSPIHVLAATLDKDYSFLPKCENWVHTFHNLTTDKIQGFYINSPMPISPIGIRAIYCRLPLFSTHQK